VKKNTSRVGEKFSAQHAGKWIVLKNQSSTGEPS
jgi:hypothetical protein